VFAHPSPAFFFQFLYDSKSRYAIKGNQRRAGRGWLVLGHPPLLSVRKNPFRTGGRAFDFSALHHLNRGREGIIFPQPSFFFFFVLRLDFPARRNKQSHTTARGVGHRLTSSPAFDVDERTATAPRRAVRINAGDTRRRSMHSAIRAHGVPALVAAAAGAFSFARPATALQRNRIDRRVAALRCCVELASRGWFRCALTRAVAAVRRLRCEDEKDQTPRRQVGSGGDWNAPLTGIDIALRDSLPAACAEGMCFMFLRHASVRTAIGLLHGAKRSHKERPA
jgi:hypothetical protein